MSVVERPAAHLPEDGSDIVLHLIDDAQLGSGRVWDTDQTRTLCMNTLAGAVTMFCEPGATIGAPALEGPTLYQWICWARGERPGTLNPAQERLLRA